MRILHLMLSNFYIDGFGYQENVLPKQNHIDGHEVKIIASTETFDTSGNLTYVVPSQYTTEYGVDIVRLPYSRFLPHTVIKKVRAYPGVYQLMEEFKPDVVLHHGAQAYELLTLAQYKKHNPGVKIYLDSHADFHNSATVALSREILHKRFYGPIVRKTIPFFEKILCLSLEAMDFLNQMYGVPFNRMEFYPLGGTILDDEERTLRRNDKRQELAIADQDVLMLHTGKMNMKKRTVELLTVFSQTTNERFRLVLAGSLGDDIRDIVEPIIGADKRINFVGWQNVDALQDLLCATDLYLQPGSQSATMQNALSCACPVMLYPYKSHEPYLKDNGFLVESIDDMADVFSKIAMQPTILKDMSGASLRIARELLDYRKLAARLYR